VVPLAPLVAAAVASDAVVAPEVVFVEFDPPLHPARTPIEKIAQAAANVVSLDREYIKLSLHRVSLDPHFGGSLLDRNPEIAAAGPQSPVDAF